MEDKRKRSRSYPGYSLEDCVYWIGKIRSELGSGPHDRGSLARALGSTGLTGASTRKIGALVHFGLLRRDASGYHVSALSERMLKPASDAEKTQALVDSFLQPGLYRELVDRFSSDGHLPARLANILIRDHGIEDVAAEDAAKIFLLSGRYAGLIDEEGSIATALREPDAPSQDVSQPEEIHRSAEARDPEPPDLPIRGSSEQRFDFVLTGGRYAHLYVPSDLTPSDVRLVEKQIELLALQAELAASR